MPVVLLILVWIQNGSVHEFVIYFDPFDSPNNFIIFIKNINLHIANNIHKSALVDLGRFNNNRDVVLNHKDPEFVLTLN